MFPDFVSRQRVRLKYHLIRRGSTPDGEDKHLEIAATRLEGTCRLFGSNQIRQFEVDTGSPFTIISREFWLSSGGSGRPSTRVSWDDPDACGPIRWGGATLEGEYHWVELDLYDWGNHISQPKMQCRLLAFVPSEACPTSFPPVLLGLGCHGIERGGLCLNLTERSDAHHDAWLIGDLMGTVDVPI